MISFTTCPAEIKCFISGIKKICLLPNQLYFHNSFDISIESVNHKCHFLVQELPKAPLFVSLHNLCATLKCINPTIATFQSAIRNAGYQISGSHVDPLALKTDAPMSVIWDIMRCWV